LRILYEKYLETLKNQKPVTQNELFPENITFSGSDVAIIEELVPELKLLGFSLNKLSNTTFVVDGRPSGLMSGSIQEIFEGILDNYKKNLLELNLDKKINLARSLAANLAIRPGKKLHQEEIMNIVDGLFACKVPEVTPDGDRIYAIVGVSDIQNLLDS
jgi:DNA mismatch repair protein MutL